MLVLVLDNDLEILFVPIDGDDLFQTRQFHALMPLFLESTVWDCQKRDCRLTVQVIVNGDPAGTIVPVMGAWMGLPCGFAPTPATHEGVKFAEEKPARAAMAMAAYENCILAELSFLRY